MTNSSQGVTATLTLSAFGQTVASSGSSTSAYMFGATSGYRTEGDAALTLVGCRFYDAQVGRFITRDTYLDQKPYAYCDGDPVNAVDPSGHDARGDTVNCLVGLAALALAEAAIMAIGTGAVISTPVIIAVVVVVVVVGAIGMQAGGEYGQQMADTNTGPTPILTKIQTFVDSL